MGQAQTQRGRTSRTQGKKKTGKSAINPWDTTDSTVPDDDTVFYSFHKRKGPQAKKQDRAILMFAHRMT
jgi:hypothetical protein